MYEKKNNMIISNTLNSKFPLFLFLTIVQLFTIEAQAQDNIYSVLNPYKYEQDIWMKYINHSSALYNYIASEAEKCLDERDAKVSTINTRKEWNDYFEKVTKKCYSVIGGFSKTPLHAVVTGKLERPGFTVDKVVYESMPGFFVTGCLFIPKTGKSPHPAVLYTIGHSPPAFRAGWYQQNILNLVSKGFVVFTFDPIGQGERTQYYDTESNQSLIGIPTYEHSYAGAQCLLAGHSISDYFIWDGVRALDYLCSRPEVDKSRIGMTGLSGGGTQTALLSSFDKRISAAAPECYITSYRRLFESIGPQDAEQNMYRGLKLGIDHVDLLGMRAPKPTMIISKTQDFFNIQGARETFQEAKEIFTAYGKPENITMVEADGTHGSAKDNRIEMHRFFQKYLSLPGNVEDEDIPQFKEDELTVSPTGQVSTAYRSKTVFDLNRQMAIGLINNRLVKSSADLIKNKELILGKIQELSGYNPNRQIQSVVYAGKVEKQNYKVEKYFIQGQSFDYPIPFVLIKPYTNEKRPLLIYLAPSGKAELLAKESEIEEYIRKGYSILSPDLIGMGELENTAFKGDSYTQGYSFNIWIGANLVGQSIAGMQASDLAILFQTIQDRKDIDIDNITSLVYDEMCSPYLHFAVFNNHIKKTILVNPLVSYEDIVMTKLYESKYMWTAVPGAIEYYDLPFLESLLANQDLVIIDPVNAKGKVIDPDLVHNQLTILRNTYNNENSKGQLNIITTGDNNSVFKLMDFMQ
jgi:cephalosporin-C deacetylase-like acetyl esterase